MTEEKLQERLKRSVVVLGLPGAGKSKVGAALAQLADAPFFDADAEIVKRAGKSIKDIFAQEGEAVFRRLERETIADLLSASEPCVLSLGGGAFMNEATRAAIAEKGALSVWLRVAPEILLERIKRSDERPLFYNVDPAAKLAELRAAREPVYATANLTVECDGRPAADNARCVWDAVRARL